MSVLTARCRFSLFYLLLIVFSATTLIASPVFAKSQLQSALDKQSLPFVQNQGQKDPRVAYYARAMGGAVFVTQQGELVYSLPKETKQGVSSWAFKETFLSEEALKPMQVGNGELATSLSLGNVAPGINIRLESRGDNVEKLFYLSPGKDVKAIKVKLQGIESSFVNEAGQLVLSTELGLIVFTKPVAFQMQGDKKQFVDVAYHLSDNQYGFTLGEYDRSKEIIIDPLLASTFVGGENTTGVVTYDYDFINAVQTIGDYVYVGGGTQSPNFPTALGFDSTYETTIEGFLMRFTNDLSTLVNATFIGNSVYDFALDSDGSVVAVGQTSVGFPKTVGAYSYPSDFDQSGGFMARFSADLTTLIAAGVIVNAPAISTLSLGNGGIYFSGRTNNPNLPVTPGAIGQNCNCDPQGAFGIRPTVGYMGRMSSDLSELQVLSYLSTGATTLITAADSSIYVGTGTIRQYDADITTLIAQGQSASDFVLVDDYIVAGGGTTNNSLSTSSGAFDSTCGTDGDCNNSGTEYYIPRADGFVAKYSMDLQTVLARTYIGGSGTDGVREVEVDDVGNIYFSGVTHSSDFPTTSNAFNRKYTDKADLFVGRISSDLTTLGYSSFIGGTHDESVMDMVLDSTGAVVIVGDTAWHDNYPTTPGAFDTTFNGGANDGFISKFDTLADNSDPGPDPDPAPSNELPVADAGVDQTVAKRTLVTLDGSNSSDSDGSIVSFSWQQTSGKGVKLKNVNNAVATFTAPRVRRGRTKTLEFELTIMDDQGATSRDRVVITVKG